MPLNQLLLIFITIPIIEIAVLLKLDNAIGLGQTIFLIFVTGIIGAWLVRQQGISIIFQIRKELTNGKIPAKQMIDGVMVLIAGAVLITPGLITDIVGFLLLIPYTRNFIRKWIRFKFEKYINSTHIITRF
ncbi:MAG: FxsA family protein [Pontiellaceae bacterium]